MVQKCVVLGCDSRWISGAIIKFHQFPKNSSARTLWLSNVTLKKNFYEGARICSLHFQESDYEPITRRLRPTAVPKPSKMTTSLPMLEIYPLTPSNSSGIYENNRLKKTGKETGQDKRVRFPTDPKLKQAWLDAINRDKVAKSAAVCSRHFKDDDYLLPSTKKLKPTAVPSVIPVKDQDVPITKICRVCLALDVKMYEINEWNLNDMFESITGIANGREDHGVYQHLCLECAVRLNTASAFKDKALLTDALLNGLLQNADFIKTRHIKAIKDNYSVLKPTLSIERVYNSSEHYKEYTSKKHIKIEYIDHEKVKNTIEEKNDIEPKSTNVANNTRSNKNMEPKPTKVDNNNKSNKNIEPKPTKVGENTRSNKNIQPKPINVANNTRSNKNIDPKPTNAGDNNKSNKNIDPKSIKVDNNNKSEEKSKNTDIKIEESDNESDFYEYEFLEEEQVLTNEIHSNDIKEENSNFNDTINDEIQTKDNIKEETNLSDDDGQNVNDNNFSDDSNNFEDEDIEVSKTYLTFDADSSLSNDDTTFFDDNKTNFNNDDIPVENIDMIEEDLDSDPVNSLNEECFTDENDEIIMDHDYIAPANMKTESKKKRKGKENIVKAKKKLKNVFNNKHLQSMTDEQQKSIKSQIAILKKLSSLQYCVNRRRNDGLDLSLFTLTKRTYEEQINDIEKRKESAKYKEAPYKCDICYMHYYKLRAFAVHREKHTDACGKLECFICRMRHKNQNGLRQHLTDRHVYYYKCNQCSFGTLTRGNVRRHTDYHKGSQFQCPHCDLVFTKSSTYLGHLRLKHLCNFACEICGYMFLSKHGVHTHKLLKHPNEINKKREGPHCDVCEVTFYSQEAHDRHLRVSAKHTREDDPNRLRNEYVSKETDSVVEKRYADYERLMKKCEYCTKMLPSRRYYAQHIRRLHPDIHRAKVLANRARERVKYPPDCMCEHCGKLFASTAHLRQHMWVHTGEKSYKCNKCPKTFTSNHGLKTHEKTIHEGERSNAVCPVCGKTLVNISNLKKHMFGHTGLKPHTCSICDKRFAWTYELRSHVNHVHLNQPWPKRVRQRRKVPKKDENATEE